VGKRKDQENQFHAVTDPCAVEDARNVGPERGVCKPHVHRDLLVAPILQKEFHNPLLLGRKPERLCKLIPLFR